MVGVSRDSQKKNDDFAASLDLQYPLVGDPDGAICKAYGTKIPLLGLSKRISFVVERDGSILAAHKGNGIGGHIAMVKDALELAG